MSNLIKSLLIPIATVLAIFLCLLAFTKITGPISLTVNSINTTKESLFTVDGKGETTATPDTALLSFGVTKKANTVQSAQNQVNTIINQITTELKTLGVGEKHIKTTSYSVNPEYDYNYGTQRLTGYNVSTNLEIKVTPIDKANQAIDIATRSGANQVGNIQFVLSDEIQKQKEYQARRQAIDEAKSKARAISMDSGLKLGRIVDVRETPQYYPAPYRGDMMLKTAEGADTPPTQLNPGENKISITVTLSYETY